MSEKTGSAEGRRPSKRASVAGRKSSSEGKRASVAEGKRASVAEGKRASVADGAIPGGKRSTRARGTIGAIAPPNAQWKTSGLPPSLQLLHPFSLEGRAVADYLVRSMPEDVEISKIERVESAKPWTTYTQARNALAEKVQGTDADAFSEVWLWRGIGSNLLDSLTSDGFQHEKTKSLSFVADPRLAYRATQDMPKEDDDPFLLVLARVSAEWDADIEKGKATLSENGAEVTVPSNTDAFPAYIVSCKCQSLAKTLDEVPLVRLDEGREHYSIDFTAYGRSKRSQRSIELIRRNEQLQAQIDALVAAEEHFEAQNKRTSIMDEAEADSGPVFARHSIVQEEAIKVPKMGRQTVVRDHISQDVQCRRTERHLRDISLDPPHKLTEAQRLCLVEALKSEDLDAATEALDVPSGTSGLELELRLDDFGPGGAITLAQALPRDIQLLDLGLTGCGIGVQGARALAQNLSPRLQQLSMGLEFCAIGEEGMTAIARRMPLGITHLELGLIGCKLGARGAEVLAENMPKALMHLRLGFTGCGIGPDGAAAICEALPQGLMHLDLDFSNCRIGPDGAQHMAKRIPPSLVHLQLDLFNCRIGDEGMKALGSKMPKSAIYIHLSLIGNKIGETGVRILGEHLPPSVVYYHLCLTGNNIGAFGARTIARNLPEHLIHLRLNLTGCQMGPEGEAVLRDAVESREKLATKELLMG